MTVMSAMLFGMAAPLSKLLLVDLNYFLLAGLLYLGAAAGLLPLILIRKSDRKHPLDKRNRWRISGSILFGGILGPVFLLLGLKIANAASVSLWLNLELVATAVLGWLFFKDQLDLLGWFSVGGALFAGVLVTFHEGRSGILAASCVTAACVCWGLDNHYTSLIDALTPAKMTFLKGLVAGSFNGFIGFFLASSLPHYRVIVGALVVGVFCYGISIVLYITAAQNLGATRSQILFSSGPFFGALFSVLLLSEQLSWIQVIAALILAISIVFLIFQRHSHGHGHMEHEHIHWHRHDDLHHTHRHIPLVSVGHVHHHKHEKLDHAHGHFPDLHHRHDHDKKNA